MLNFDRLYFTPMLINYTLYKILLICSQTLAFLGSFLYLQYAAGIKDTFQWKWTAYRLDTWSFSCHSRNGTGFQDSSLPQHTSFSQQQPVCNCFPFLVKTRLITRSTLAFPPDHYHGWWAQSLWPWVMCGLLLRLLQWLGGLTKSGVAVCLPLDPSNLPSACLWALVFCLLPCPSHVSGILPSVYLSLTWISNSLDLLYYSFYFCKIPYKSNCLGLSVFH